MKGFTILLLGIIIITLISEYTEYVDADHLIPGPGIFTDEGQVELITSTDSEYQIYLQVVIRDKDGSLVNVIESTATGAFIPHEITNHVFYDLMGVKEVIVLDNTEYEKEYQKITISSNYQKLQNTPRHYDYVRSAQGN